MGTSLHYSAGRGTRVDDGDAPRDRIPINALLVTIGAAMMAGGLWAPWFRLELPEQFFSQAFAAAGVQDQSGFVQMMGAQLDQMQRDGQFQVTAWEAFEQADLIIAGAAALAVLAIVLTLSHHLSRFPVDLVTFGALAAAGVVVFRGFVNRPGPSDMPLVGMWGIWLSLAGCIVVAVGSRLSFKP